MNLRVAALLDDILTEVRARPARAGLTVTAIGIGVAALTALLAVLAGLDQRAEQAMRSLGTGVIAIVGAPTVGPIPVGGLSHAHADLLRVNFTDAVVGTLRRYPAPTLGSPQPLTVLEAGPELLAMRQWRVARGRFLDEADVRSRARTTVVSEGLARRWGWRPGTVILVGSIAFTIIGVVEHAGAADATSDSALAFGPEVVIVPHTTMPRWQQESSFADTRVDVIFIQADDVTAVARVLVEAQQLLAEPGLQTGELTWLTAASLTRETRSLQAVLTLTMGSASVLLLALGGATLMSLCAANTRERCAEIGVRRAIGATRTDIAALFVTEAVVFATAAAGCAVVGVAVGLPFLARWVPIAWRFEPATVVVPVLVSVVLAAAFAWWPARSAARLEPAMALRP